MSNYKCEICGTELSDEWVKFNEPNIAYHRLCYEHREMYLEAKGKVEIVWDGKKFIPVVKEGEE